MRGRKITLRLALFAALCAPCPAARAQSHAGEAAAQPRPVESAAHAGGGAQQGGSQGADSTPPGMVAFFMTETCPAGWFVPASAQGRLIVGVTDASAVGLTVNAPMASGTAPTHQHGYSTTVNLNRKNIALANGSNNQGAKKGNYPVSGTTEPAASDLPFIQLTVCQKQ